MAPSPVSPVPHPSSINSPSKARSTGSIRYPSSSHWKPLNKLGNAINLPGRKSNDSSDSLTKESLEAHDRRQQQAAAVVAAAAFIHHDRNFRSSPYYKGLTDQSLAINNHGGRNNNLPSSPGRETLASSSSSSSFYSFISKMQVLSSSCYFFKTNTNNNTAKTISTTTATNTADHAKLSTRRNESATSLSYPLSAVEDNSSDNNESVTSASFERKEIRDLNAFLITCKEKPLRERIYEQERAQQPPLKTIETITSKADPGENEFVWAKRYRPQALEEFICNHDKAIKLEEKLRNEECGHFIFEGPPGVGKRTMILAMLRKVYGAQEVNQTRDARKTINLKVILLVVLGESIGSLKVDVRESSRHLEINLSDIKEYEKSVIVELIRGKDSNVTNNSSPCNPENSRAIILNEADKLSSEALLYLKWLFERYDNNGCTKVFFCCSDASKLQPIRPLCTLVQLSPPSKQEVVKVLEFIAEKEGIELPHRFAESITENSNKNLRQAIRSFEATWRASYPFKEDEEILTGWEHDIANIAKSIVQEQTPRQLYDIRVKLRHLTEHDISADYIFKSLVKELKKFLPENLRHHVDMLYEDYNRDEGGMFDREKPLAIGRNRLEPRRTSAQQFLRIEEFIAKFMSWCKLSVPNNKTIVSGS
ncbi:replication factor C subunit 3-like [Rutidosis leptorrhynchoides]|uniref:replication factor C subunit 3-like n=1 Tax=Rutidosis leptorrhynchoides TaxID=125765 RepID=UPI003A9A25AB